MNSEKVKEIKKRLKYCQTSKFDLLGEALTLINELESENERLNKSDTSKEESSIEYYNLYKDLKRKNKDLNELCELQRVSISESFVRENQLKDRIAELEKELETRKEEVLHLQEYGKKLIRETELTQFAERLRNFFIENYSTYAYVGKSDYENEIKVHEVISGIDETLKEFIQL